MKTSILQSILARNKEVITGLHDYQAALIKGMKLNKSNNKKLFISEDQLEYYWSLYFDKRQNLQKNQKSLKQLAAIQKAIKEEIKFNDSVAGVNLFKED